MNLFGIKVGIHWSWWILVAMVAIEDLSITGIVSSGLLIISIGVIIIGHEFAHALTARRFGYETHSISLHILGGVAMVDMTGIKPKQMFWIALAGPAFNLALFAPTILLLSTGIFAAAPILETAVSTFAIFNLFIGLFNLLPAWPMDGGRILRALLSNYEQKFAMDISHILSAGCAVLFIVYGVLVSNPLMFLVAAILIGLIWYERKRGEMMNM